MTRDEARARIGHQVTYRPPMASESEPGKRGVITSVGMHCVFVRFGGIGPSQACAPQQLTPARPR